MKKITASILTTLLMLSMVFSSSVFAANEEVSAWDSFLGLFSGNATTTATDAVGVEYRGHIQNVGNFPLDGTWIQGPNQLGTVGQSLRLEGFWIQLSNQPENVNIQYRVHVQNEGWMTPVENGAFAGTEGKSQQIEAIEINLVDDEGNAVQGYSVQYKGHIQNQGDTAWFEDGQQLGTVGSFLRLEALEVKIVSEKADMAAYEAAVAEATALTEADYTAASWAALETALIDNLVTEDNTQAEVDAATAAINAAIDALVEVTNVSSLTATGVKTLKVTFNKAVDDTLATFVVKKGTTTSNVSSITWNEEKTEATLAMASKLTEGTYKVTVSGVDLKINNASVDVENEVATTIDFLGNQAAINAGGTQATIGYAVYNQYGETLTATAPTITWTPSLGTASGSAATGIVTLSGTYTVGQELTLTGVISTLGVVTTEKITIGSVATVSEVTFEGIYNADDEELLTSSTYADFVVLLEAKDQYGNKLTAAEVNSATVLSSSNTSVVTVTNVAANQGPDADQLGIVLGEPASKIEGTSTIRIISKTTGQIFNFDVTVKKAATVSTIAISQPDDTVAVGETVEIPFVAEDQYGTAVTTYSGLNGKVTLSPTTGAAAEGTLAFKNDLVNKKAVLQYTAPNTAGTYVLMAYVPGSTSVSQFTLKVEEAATPTVVEGIVDVEKNLADGGTTILDIDNIVINDQYGRVMEMTDALLGATNVIVSSATAGVVSVTNGTINDVTDEVTLTGVSKGSAVITIELDNVDGSEYTFTSKVVENGDITEYAVEDFALLYESTDYLSEAAADFAVPVVVKGTNGATVVIPKEGYAVTVNDPYSKITYSTATNKLVGTTTIGTYDTGATTRIVPVVITVYGEDGPVIINKNLTVTNAPRKDVAMELVSDGNFVKEDTTVLSIDATDGAADIATAGAFKTAVLGTIVGTDQYGVDYSDAADFISTANIFISNISAHGFGTFVDGDSFKATVVTNNGQTIIIDVLIVD